MFLRRDCWWWPPRCSSRPASIRIGIMMMMSMISSAAAAISISASFIHDRSRRRLNQFNGNGKPDPKERIRTPNRYLSQRAMRRSVNLLFPLTLEANFSEGLHKVNVNIIAQKNISGTCKRTKSTAIVACPPSTHGQLQQSVTKKDTI